tara:strand:+ start:43 stop:501 length:459 start_codon:yes stop_codon:yes gene_type:complete
MDEIAVKLEGLEADIKNKSYLNDLKKNKDWGGADVVIAPKMTESLDRWIDSQPEVITGLDYKDYGIIENRRRLVITKYSKELSWLIYELRDIFSKYIDWSTKYEFYGVIAHQAQYKISTDKDCACEELLMFVVREAAWKYMMVNEEVFKGFS